MARKARIEFAGAVYHVMDRGDRREAIFRDDHDHQTFLATLEEVCARTGWRIHAYVLMNNHYHLLLETPQANLVRGMHWFQCTYTARFNRRHSLRGHLFQGRYKAVVVDPGERSYFATLSDYIHLNPVRAGIIPVQGKLYDYPWSSYPGYVGKAKRPGWLEVNTVLEELGCEDNAGGRRRYAERLQGRAREKDIALPEIRSTWCLGGDAFRKRMLNLLDTLSDKLSARKPVDGAVRRSHGEDAAEELLGRATETLGMSEQELRRLKNKDMRKATVGVLLKKHTTVSNGWLAQRLDFGHSSAISRLRPATGAGSFETELKKLENAIFKT